MEKKHTNYYAYDNFECFELVDEEKKYREKKLNGCEKHVDFISKIFNKNKINFLELGSGNSKLSINLNKNNFLKQSYDFEISKNRCEFAKKWIKDIGYNNINVIEDSFVNLPKYDVKNIDLCFCIDLALQFVDPVEKNSDLFVLKNVYNLLNTGGVIVIEIDGCKRIIDSINHSNKIWEEFDYPDPWLYSLWDCKYNFLDKHLKWKKTYISRDFTKVDKSEIILKIYSSEEIKNILLTVGFKDIQLYKNWGMDEYENDFSEFIIVAKK